MTYPPQPAGPQPGPGPVNALMWEPFGLATRLLFDPRGRFVVMSDGATLHGIVCGVAQRFGMKIRFRADRYKPRKRQIVVAETGTALAASFDPTPGFLVPHGTVTTAWGAQPDGLITLTLNQTTATMGSGNTLATTVFPRFALELYGAFVQSRLLVWAGALDSGSNGDLAQWRTAPGSPTPLPPYAVTEAGLAAARAAGWQPHKI